MTAVMILFSLPVIFSVLFSIAWVCLLAWAIFKLTLKLGRWASAHTPMNKSRVIQLARDYDNEENGFNPVKQNYLSTELFPVDVDIKKIMNAREELFKIAPEFIKRADDKYLYSFFYDLLVEREKRIRMKTWNEKLEKMWSKFPYRPRQMAKLDQGLVTYAIGDADTSFTPTNLAC